MAKIEGVSSLANSQNQVRPQSVSQARPVEAVKTSPEVSTASADVARVQMVVTGKESSSAKDGTSDQREVSNEHIKKAVADLNKKMNNTSCQFGIHEGTGRVTIKVIDKETKDVIKEFPAEETLNMIEKAWELAGIMVDEKL